MGFVVLGLAVYALVYGQMHKINPLSVALGLNQLDAVGYRTDAIMAANGAVLQMFNHGLSAAGYVLYGRCDL